MDINEEKEEFPTSEELDAEVNDQVGNGFDRQEKSVPFSELSNFVPTNNVNVIERLPSVVHTIELDFEKIANPFFGIITYDQECNERSYSEPVEVKIFFVIYTHAFVCVCVCTKEFFNIFVCRLMMVLIVLVMRTDNLILQCV